MELLTFWRMLRRWWWLLVLGLVVGAGGVLFVARRSAPVYQASTRLFINQVQISPGLASTNDIQASESLARTYADLLTSRQVLQDASQRLSLSLTPAALSKKISVTVVTGTQFLDVAVTDSSPTQAALIANQVAAVFISRVQDLQAGNAAATLQQINQEIAGTRQRMADLSASINRATSAGGKSSTAATALPHLQAELIQSQDQYQYLLDLQQRTALLRAQALSTVSVVDPAIAPTTRVATGSTKSVLVAAMLGLLLAGGIALVLDQLDDTLREPGDLWRRFGLDPLATVKLIGDGQAALPVDPPSADSERLAEALHVMRMNLQQAQKSGAQAFCVGSAVKGEGKSTVAAHLARIEAGAGRRVVLVDANLREPAQHAFFRLNNGYGLSNLLQMAEGASLPLQQGPLGLQILTAGPAPSNPLALLDSARMAALMAQLRTMADLIILDTPAILAVADTLLLQQYVDGTLLVADMQRTGGRTVEQALLALQQCRATVLGIVLNKGRQERPVQHPTARTQQVRTAPSLTREASE